MIEYSRLHRQLIHTLGVVFSGASRQRCQIRSGKMLPNGGKTKEGGTLHE